MPMLLNPRRCIMIPHAMSLILTQGSMLLDLCSMLLPRLTRHLDPRSTGTGFPFLTWNLDAPVLAP